MFPTPDTFSADKLSSSFVEATERMIALNKQITDYQLNAYKLMEKQAQASVEAAKTLLDANLAFQASMQKSMVEILKNQAEKAEKKA